MTPGFTANSLLTHRARTWWREFARRSPSRKPLAKRAAGKPSLALMPKAFAEFKRNCETLERHYRDIQDIEFTIQEGKLWMLQCRNGKRTTPAALKIAVDFAREGLITKEEAITRIEAAQLDQVLHPTIDPSAERNILTTGLPASPGAACGEIVFSPTMPRS